MSLAPSGSGSISHPTNPNNINFGSNVGSPATIGGTTDAWTGTLDIGNNGLVVSYGAGSDPYAQILNLIKSGYANGLWTGKGIISSLAKAAANSAAPLNLGLLDFTPGQHNQPTSIFFAGQTITTSAVLVRLTYMDDLILAGDMTQGNASYTDGQPCRFRGQLRPRAIATWTVGDLNHDGVIDTSDALIFSANYVVGLPSLDGTTGNAASLGGIAAAVPEPSSITLTIAAALGALVIARRRRIA